MADWNAVEGAPEALAEWVTDIGPRLYRYFALSFPAFVASDLVQEVLVRLLRQYRDGRFDSRRGSLRMLAFGIAHYVRLETLKAQAADVRSHAEYNDQTTPGPEDLMADAQNRERVCRLRQAIARLKEVERQIVLLHIDEEMTLVDIGTLMRMPVGTVKSHLHRAKEGLRVLLSEREKS